jgi:hypothetical protein
MLAGAWIGIMAVQVASASHFHHARTSSEIGDELCSRVEELYGLVHPDAFNGNGLTAAEYEIAVGKLTKQTHLLAVEFREARNREEIAAGHKRASYDEP